MYECQCKSSWYFNWKSLEIFITLRFTLKKEKKEVARKNEILAFRPVEIIHIFSSSHNGTAPYTLYDKSLSCTSTRSQGSK